MTLPGQTEPAPAPVETYLSVSDAIKRIKELETANKILEKDLIWACTNLRNLNRAIGDYKFKINHAPDWSFPISAVMFPMPLYHWWSGILNRGKAAR